jgi:hypothetical protein
VGTVIASRLARRPLLLRRAACSKDRPRSSVTSARQPTRRDPARLPQDAHPLQRIHRLGSPHPGHCLTRKILGCLRGLHSPVDGTAYGETSRHRTASSVEFRLSRKGIGYRSVALAFAGLPEPVDSGVPGRATAMTTDRSDRLSGALPSTSARVLRRGSVGRPRQGVMRIRCGQRRKVRTPKGSWVLTWRGRRSGKAPSTPWVIV